MGFITYASDSLSFVAFGFGWVSSNFESSSLMVRLSMEPLENVREDAEGKGGGDDVEELTGFRTTIMRLSTCSSVNELVDDTF